MNLIYDKQADALDIRLMHDVLVSLTEEIDSGTLVDLDERGRVVAIEVIRPARRWPLEEVLDRFALEDDDAEILRALWLESDTLPFATPAELSSTAVPA
jgi:uncharacterized protein YuzE